MQTLVLRARRAWSHPLMKSTWAVSVDPCIVGDIDKVKSAALDVG